MDDKKGLKRITFLVDVETYEALRQKAFNEHVGMSKLIRDGLPLIINEPVAQPKHGGYRDRPAAPKMPPKQKIDTDNEPHYTNPED